MDALNSSLVAPAAPLWGRLRGRLRESPPRAPFGRLGRDCACGVAGAVDALRAIFSGPPTAMRSIVLTGNNHRSETITALQLGARGIVLKTSDSEMLFRSIRAVMSGEFWLWHRNVVDGVEAIRLIMAEGDISAKAERYRLTPRELEI